MAYRKKIYNNGQVIYPATMERLEVLIEDANSDTVAIGGNISKDTTELNSLAGGIWVTPNVVICTRAVYESLTVKSPYVTYLVNDNE